MWTNSRFGSASGFMWSWGSRGVLTTGVPDLAQFFYAFVRQFRGTRPALRPFAGMWVTAAAIRHGSRHGSVHPAGQRLLLHRQAGLLGLFPDLSTTRNFLGSHHAFLHNGRGHLEKSTFSWLQNASAVLQLSAFFSRTRVPFVPRRLGRTPACIFSAAASGVGDIAAIVPLPPARDRTQAVQRPAAYWLT